MIVRLLAAGAAVVALSALGRAASFTNFESGHVRPLALAPGGNLLLAVNTPDGRLTVYAITATGLAVAAEVPVGLEPVAVAARTNPGGNVEAWVVNHLSDSISIVEIDPLDVAGARVVRTLLVGDEPRDVVFAGSGGDRVFVTAAHRGQNRAGDPQLTTEGIGRADVWAFDADNLGAAKGGTALSVIQLFGDTPRALAATPDGATVYAAVFHSGNRTTTLSEPVVSGNGGLPPPPPGSTPGAPPTSLVVKFDGTRWVDEIARDWSAFVPLSLPDQDVFLLDANANPPALAGGANTVSGVGTVLFNMAVRPTNGRVYVSNTDARNEVRFEPVLTGNLVRSRITIIAGTTPTAQHLNPHIDYGVIPGPPEEVAETLAFPTDLAFSADGNTLFVAGLGSGKIGAFDANALEAGAVIRYLVGVGDGPSGLAVDAARDRVYVMNRISHNVSVVSNASIANLRGETARVSLRFDPSPVQTKVGRRFLYDARRTSAHGDQACATCHVFGDFDSLTWDLGDPSGASVANPNPFRNGGSGNPFHPMKGPMTTQSLRGMADAGPMHWRGDRTGGTTGGDPLDEDAAFKAFNPAFVGLLGRGSQLTDAEMQAFTDFILTVKYPPNPIHALDNVDTTAEAAGRSFFLNDPVDGGNTCDFCHRVPLGTDGFSSFEGEPQEFKIPHLRNAYQKVGMFGLSPGTPGAPGGILVGDQVRGSGFLHDGAVSTVFLFLNASVFNFGSTPNVKRRNLEAFILGLDTGLAPIVGQQATLTAAAFGDAPLNAQIDLLLARADAGECDVVAKGMLGAEGRGALYAGGGTWLGDRAADGTLSTATVKNRALTAGQEVTFTCVPPGNGLRVAIDRDLDGIRDRDELDATTNPADATSVPGGATFVTVESSSMELRDKTLPVSDPSRRRFNYRSSSKLDPIGHRVVPPAAGGSSDPTLHGATVTIYNSNGTGETVTIALPAANWTNNGAVPPAYTYKDVSVDPAIKKVTLKTDNLRINGSKANFAYTLDEPQQGRIAVRFQLGAATVYCSDAGARASGKPPTTTRNDQVDKFRAQSKAPYPEFCPILPIVGSASGAFLDD